MESSLSDRSGPNAVVSSPNEPFGAFPGLERGLCDAFPPASRPNKLTNSIQERSENKDLKPRPKAAASAKAIMRNQQKLRPLTVLPWPIELYIHIYIYVCTSYKYIIYIYISYMYV